MHRSLDELNAVEVTNLIACARPPLYLISYHLYLTVFWCAKQTVQTQVSSACCTLRLVLATPDSSLLLAAPLANPSMTPRQVSLRLWGNRIGIRDSSRTHHASPPPPLRIASTSRFSAEVISHRSAQQTHGEHSDEDNARTPSLGAQSSATP